MPASRLALRLFASFLVAATAACEHETAPKIRDAIEATQRKALGGNLGRLGPPIGLALDQVSQRFWMSSIFPRDTIVVQRGEDRFLMLATVLERVYVPPGGTGARPSVRRTILLWQESAQVAFVVMSDDSIAPVATDYYAVNKPLQQITSHTGAVLEAENHRAWFGRDGTIEILNGIKTGTCPFGGDTAARYAVVDGQDRQAPDAACERSMYSVSVRATLEAGDPTHRSALESVAGHHPSLFIDAQIPGLRFVTKCQSQYPNNMPPEGCGPWLAFWRDESQYAPELGIEWLLFREAPTGLYVHEIAPGTGRSYQDGSLFLPEGPVRYRLLAPDGQLISSGVVDDVRAGGKLSILQTLGPFRPGYHGIAIGPADVFGTRADPFVPMPTPAVLDFEFLPPGVRPQ